MELNGISKQKNYLHFFGSFQKERIIHSPLPQRHNAAQSNGKHKIKTTLFRLPCLQMLLSTFFFAVKQ